VEDRYCLHARQVGPALSGQEAVDL
jgi:hypothetical protein